MYGLFTSHCEARWQETQETHILNPPQSPSAEPSATAAISRHKCSLGRESPPVKPTSMRKRSARSRTLPLEVHHQNIEEEVDALLQDHQKHLTTERGTTPVKKKASSLILHRRDSSSTISTAAETPKNSMLLDKFIPTGMGGEIPTVIIFFHEARLFPREMPLIQKAKFVPDSMNVCDFYGDDDEEIVFVPGDPTQHANETPRDTECFHEAKSRPSGGTHCNRQSSIATNHRNNSSCQGQPNDVVTAHGSHAVASPRRRQSHQSCQEHHECASPRVTNNAIGTPSRQQSGFASRTCLRRGSSNGLDRADLPTRANQALASHFPHIHRIEI